MQVHIDDDVATVLFDFLSRSLEEQNGVELTDAIRHPGELWALSILLGSLEKSLTLPFDSDYHTRVEIVRE